MNYHPNPSEEHGIVEREQFTGIVLPVQVLHHYLQVD